MKVGPGLPAVSWKIQVFFSAPIRKWPPRRQSCIGETVWRLVRLVEYRFIITLMTFWSLSPRPGKILGQWKKVGQSYWVQGLTNIRGLDVHMSSASTAETLLDGCFSFFSFSQPTIRNHSIRPVFYVFHIKKLFTISAFWLYFLKLITDKNSWGKKFSLCVKKM